MEQSLLAELTGSQLVKKLPAFYATRMFITVFTRTPPPLLILSQINTVHASLFYFL